MAAQSLTIAPRTYQLGETSANRSIPNAAKYTGFHITADYSSWTNPSTTLVRIGIRVSYDNGVTYQEVTHADENTPPPWVGRWGTSSSVTIDVSYAGGVAPDHVQGFIFVEGASVPMGQITVNLE